VQDIIIIQITGSKHWKIYDCPVAYPVAGMAEQAPPRNEPVFRDTLRPGDLLFLPAGHWHHCENGPGRSLHLGIMMEPPTGWHWVQALLSQVLAEEMFRIPLTRIGSQTEKAALEAALKGRLTQKAAQISFSPSVAEGQRTQAPNGHQTSPG